MTHDERLPGSASLEQLKELAALVATELKAAAGDAGDAIAGTGGGSLHRNLPDSLRAMFIDVRAALFRRGIYDPVLVRFDTASAPQASTRDIAEQLEQVAAAL